MSQTFNGERESMVKIERSRSATNDSDVLEVYIRPESITERGGKISSVENSPVLPSLYEHRMRRLLQLNPPLATNRVHIPWYRRYVDAIPEKDQQFTFQPFREIQTRDEDIALQHQFGYHECMQEYVTRGMCRYPPAECKKFREAAMSRLSRIRRREQEKKEKKQRGGPQQEDTVGLLGHDIDFATEFGFSANKKRVIVPVVTFMSKLQTNREREALRWRHTASSEWAALATRLREKLRDLIRETRRQQVRKRIRRLFNLVLCVDRFIKCVAMIAGDTQTLLKDTTYRSCTNYSFKDTATTTSDDRPSKEVNVFNFYDYSKVGQIQVPFHIQMILGKPWFCRTNKEVETAVKFLEKMRCFTAYPKPFQYMLARIAWYIELPTQKVIIRQSQQAVNFYLILNGTVKIEKLEGSPCYTEDGHFVTTKILSSQDMFGDECVTQPFSERWYTATTEEKCAALDFNMHDYNNMIQTANTSEEAPDHIRFLCKLRIMDHFPKIKLLQEQDNNVTYFFFRPGTLVCKSVRESPYIFVVRNGSCSLLQELEPKLSPERKSQIILRRASMLPTEQIPGTSRMTVGLLSPINQDGGGKGSRVFEDSQRCSIDEEKVWFVKTKASFDKNKLEIRESIRSLKDKAESIAKTLPSHSLEKFNLGDRSKTELVEKTEMNLALSSSGNLPSLRWNLGEQGLDESSPYTFSDKEIGASLSASFSNKFGMESVEDIQPKRSMIVGSNIELTPYTLSGEKRLSLIGSTSSNLNNSAKSKRDLTNKESSSSGGSTWSKELAKGFRLSTVSVASSIRKECAATAPSSRKSRAVPTLGSTKSGAVKTPGSTKSGAVKTPSSTKSGAVPTPGSTKSGAVKTPSSTKSDAVKTPSSTKSGAVPTSGSTKSGAAPMLGNRRSSAVLSTGGRKSVAARGEADYPLSRYSQWTQKALLTVTDVAGVDWLDYRDGNYNPPQEDMSLVSHGATIIMIKKSFMLKYLRRNW